MPLIVLDAHDPRRLCSHSIYFLLMARLDTKLISKRLSAIFAPKCNSKFISVQMTYAGDNLTLQLSANSGFQTIVQTHIQTIISRKNTFGDQGKPLHQISFESVSELLVRNEADYRWNYLISQRQNHSGFILLGEGPARPPA